MTALARHVSRAALVACASMAIGTLSAGVVANGTVPFNFNSVSSSSNTWTASTVFTIGGVSVSGDGSGSFTCTPSPTADSVCNNYGATIASGTFPGNNLMGQTIQFDGGTVTGTLQYQYVVTSQDAPVITNPSASQTGFLVDTNGTFTDLRGAGGFDSAPASMVFTFNENCTGSTCSDSGSATFATPPAFTTTPEPFSMALMGGGLLALGLIRRKRSA